MQPPKAAAGGRGKGGRVVEGSYTAVVGGGGAVEGSYTAAAVVVGVGVTAGASLGRSGLLQQSPQLLDDLVETGPAWEGWGGI